MMMRALWIPSGLFVALGLVTVSGCMGSRDVSPPMAVVSPAPSKPHVILSVNQSVVRKGDEVEVLVTFVNPTKKKIHLPTESSFKDDEYDSISHRLYIEWNGKHGGSSFGVGHRSIYPHPPSPNYLEPGQSKSYRLLWEPSYDGAGEVELKYQFGWGDTFPPVKLTLTTR